MADWSSLDDTNHQLNSGHSSPLNAESIGRKVAGMVVFLVNHGLLSDPTRVHIIG